MGLTVVLAASQISQFAVLGAFLAFATPEDLSAYLVVIMLAQILWGVMILRLDIQVQSDRVAPWRKWFLGLGLAMALCWTAAGAAATLVLGLGDTVLWSVLSGGALAVLALARSDALARAGPGPLARLEAGVILRNLGCLAVAAAGVPPGPVFLGGLALHGGLVALWLTGGLAFGRRGGPGRGKGRARFCIARLRAARVLRYSLPASFVGMLNSRLPLLALALVWPVAAAPFLAAYRLAHAPLGIVLPVLRAVAVRLWLAAERAATGQTAAPARLRVLFLAMAAAAPVALAPLAFAPALMNLLPASAAPWEDAARMMPLVYPIAVLTLLTGWTDRLFDLSGHQPALLVIEGIALLGALAVSAVIWSGVVGPVRAPWLIVGLGAAQSLAWAVACLSLPLATRPGSRGARRGPQPGATCHEARSGSMRDAAHT